MITETIAAKTVQKGIITEKSQFLIESTSLKPVSISYHLYASTENKDFLLMVDHWKNTEVLEVNIQTEYFNVFCVAIEDIIIEKIGTGIYSVDKMFIIL